jgi:hypothetical protein
MVSGRSPKISMSSKTSDQRPSRLFPCRPSAGRCLLDFSPLNFGRGVPRWSFAPWRFHANGHRLGCNISAFKRSSRCRVDSGPGRVACSSHDQGSRSRRRCERFHCRRARRFRPTFGTRSRCAAVQARGSRRRRSAGRRDYLSVPLPTTLIAACSDFQSLMTSARSACESLARLPCRQRS